MGRMVSTIIIIDSCTYSRIACADILFRMYSETPIFSFECFTDFKLWDLQQVGRGSGPYYIIFNAAVGPFYTTDVQEFLIYENEARQYASSPTHILMLTSRSRPLIYPSEIMTHYMIKTNVCASMAVISSFLRLKVSIFRWLLTIFISEGADAVNRLFCHRDSDVKDFSLCEFRAMMMLMSGESVETVASRHRVAVKTLYTQRSQVLEKLTL
ncbi:hypothetical protein [Enterobacter quasiroggenkampii]|uniref:hypothetical protein n=1 Tax=Enterobacter quasiroggenkampii TaxID=2497436 RepID=UPI0039C126EE